MCETELLHTAVSITKDGNAWCGSRRALSMLQSRAQQVSKTRTWPGAPLPPLHLHLIMALPVEYLIRLGPQVGLADSDGTAGTNSSHKLHNRTVDQDQVFQPRSTLWHSTPW